MILATGHRGFVGGYLAGALGEYVGYDLVDGDDIRDGFKLYKALTDNKVDTIVHCAARAGVRTSTLFPEEYISTNINGTRTVLETAEKAGVGHVILFSSSSVYGSQKPPNTEDVPPRPDSIYGITKAASEMLGAISSVPTTVIRPFTLYGKNGRKDQVVYKWLHEWSEGKPLTFYGDGTSKRGYTHVEDLMDGLAAIIKNGPPPSGHELYNLGGSEIVSLEDMAAIFAAELPDVTWNRLPKPSADVFENWADTSKARRELGWMPTRDFKTEMIRIIRDFKQKIATASAFDSNPSFLA